MFDWIKRQLAGARPAADPYEEFVREILAECQRQNVLPRSYDPNARGFIFVREDGSELAQFLHNGFREWLVQDREGRNQLTTRWVGSVLDRLRNDTLDPDKLPGELMPGIRSAAQISNVLIRNWTAGAPPDDSSATAFRPFLGDLVVCAMRVGPNSMSQMTNINLAAMRLSLDQAMQHAMANFRDRIPRPEFEPVGDGLFGSTNLVDHQSAMLLLTPGTDYSLPAIDGAPIALVPARNLVYLTGSANKTGLTKLLDIAQQARQMAHFLSSAILQWDGHRWVEAELTGELTRRQREIAQYQLTDAYGRQKHLLDQYHFSKGQDVFVGNLMPYSPPELTSFTTLGSGTIGTLLPHADRIFLAKQIIDPQTGLAQQQPEDRVDVAWSDAINIAGYLFEPVPYLHPPRLRAVGFPADDLWARLKAVAR